jgi:hypothetical protein
MSDSPSLADSGTRAHRVDEGECAVVSAGPPERATVTSRGFLPLRVRTDGVPYRRPAFCGTALVLGEQTYEVIAETQSAEGVTYALRPWPAGEVVRDRLVYGPRLVREAQEDRDRAARRERVRPYRFLLYPLVGFLPAERQERVALGLGLYSVTATAVSGVVEGLLPFAAMGLIGRSAEPWLAVVLVLLTPLVWFFCLAGFSRSFAAVAFRETSGPFLVEAGSAAWKALVGGVNPVDTPLVPLTRAAFWVRLGGADEVTTEGRGAYVFRGLLPHLTWHTGHHVRAHGGYWLVEELPPALEGGRLVYRYRLAAAATDSTPPLAPPASDAYAAEVRAQIEREWDDLLGGFSWLASLLSTAVQHRAFDRRGGPPAARRPTWVTAFAGFAFAGFVLAQPREAGDPIGPWLRLTSVLLLVDGAVRLARTSRGRYAPSLFRFALPSDALRPERIAYQAHRDAEGKARGQVVPLPS